MSPRIPVLLPSLCDDQLCDHPAIQPPLSAAAASSPLEEVRPMQSRQPLVFDRERFELQAFLFHCGELRHELAALNAALKNLSKDLDCSKIIDPVGPLLVIESPSFTHGTRN